MKISILVWSQFLSFFSDLVIKYSSSNLSEPLIHQYSIVHISIGRLTKFIFWHWIIAYIQLKRHAICFTWLSKITAFPEHPRYKLLWNDILKINTFRTRRILVRIETPVSRPWMNKGDSRQSWSIAIEKKKKKIGNYTVG